MSRRAPGAGSVCPTGKPGFDTEREAKKSIPKRSNHNGAILRTYICSVCGKHHHTHQRPRSILRLPTCKRCGDVIRQKPSGKWSHVNTSPDHRPVVD